MRPISKGANGTFPCQIQRKRPFSVAVFVRPKSSRSLTILEPYRAGVPTKAEVKAALLGDADPYKWDLPPKPRGMRWVTYERWVAKYDAAEEMLNAQLAIAAAWLMKGL